MTWTRAWSWQDVKQGRAASKAWQPSKAAGRRYTKQLRSVGKEVSKLLDKGLDPAQAQQQLEAYAQALEPWAEQSATNMVRSCKRKTDQTWRASAERWGIDIKGLLNTDISEAVRTRVAENIRLIKSIPAQAAENVGQLAHEAVLAGTRAEEMATRIAAEGNIAMNRARTIATTEISKASTALIEARAQGVGSDGYIWRTTRDGSRRSSHAAMEGKFVRWDKPPTLDGMTGHAGEFPNCRCYPEPVIHDSKGKEVDSPMPTMKQEKVSGSHKLRSQWERQDFNPVTPHHENESLHNVTRANFDLGKLTNYSMDPTSKRGKHKARVWEAALGMDKSHAKDVEQQILRQLPELPSHRDQVDEHGERFYTLAPVAGPNGRSVDVRAVWIYDRDQKSGTVSTKPRLVTCFVP
jgi:SPP1 gp7 family putative phage head morphogenesis protein